MPSSRLGRTGYAEATGQQERGPGGVMALPTHDPQVIERERTRVLPPYRVLIHDDPIHTYHEVALAVQQTVPGKSYADGWAIATLVDTTGQAVAATCPK